MPFENALRGYANMFKASCGVWISCVIYLPLFLFWQAQCENHFEAAPHSHQWWKHYFENINL